MEATNAQFIDGSDLGINRLRKALAVDMKIGRFDFTLIAVHLKSARGYEEAETRNKQADVISSFITDFREFVPDVQKTRIFRAEEDESK